MGWRREKNKRANPTGQRWPIRGSGLEKSSTGKGGGVPLVAQNWKTIDAQFGMPKTRVSKYIIHGGHGAFSVMQQPGGVLEQLSIKGPVFPHVSLPLVAPVGLGHALFVRMTDRFNPDQVFFLAMPCFPGGGGEETTL